MNQIDRDARRIANEIVLGDYQTASSLWEYTISNLKTFEAAALRDKIRQLVTELETAKNNFPN